MDKHYSYFMQGAVEKLGGLVNKFLRLFRVKIITLNTLRYYTTDEFLYNYDSYEEYKQTQVFLNKQKIDRVWADKETLSIVAEVVKGKISGNDDVFGLCHGSRNGYEQQSLAEMIPAEVIGTDISDTADQYPNSVVWDFHDENPEWVGRCDFVYTNSLDQSWKPKDALNTWLDQLKIGGVLIIEQTEGHGPTAAGRMDPFGAKPKYMPYLLTSWLGSRVTLEIIESTKSNYGNHVWLFALTKLS
ncbi:MAG: class I SAM-dependent methyltransferase [Chloroflexi bacterium]|nr:class I SAM-dependent methyltransferase [Chloroflexota bacterium]